MEKRDLAKLAVKHLSNSIAETMCIQAGLDYTKPTAFYGLVNERCNIQCQYCEYWRLDQHREEMSIDEWMAALQSIKAFVGTYSINFSGGEPFLKKGFISLLEYCRDQGIQAGFTTNGVALTRKNVERIVEVNPFNANISCDSCEAVVNDLVRGCKGLTDRVATGIHLLLEYQNAHGINFPILMKPTVHALSYHRLPELVQWAEKLGVSGVHMQPMDRWTPETFGELWISKDQLRDLEVVVEKLCSMKRQGSRILNSEDSMRMWVDHFLELSAPQSAMPCRVGLRDFFIRPDGSVEVCWSYPTIGNIRVDSAESIWRGPIATEIRMESLRCEKLCLQTCMSKKSLLDKAKMAYTLMR